MNVRVAPLVVTVALVVTVPLLIAASKQSNTVTITVNEGTSIAVAASPDGRTLAIDLQGSIWTLPSSGGAATQITDGFDDARQPTWSPDGRSIAFQGYRDGSYDIWAVSADGTNRRKITSGPHDDREPAWSNDGSRIAFSSDRARDGNYDVWTVDVQSGAVTRISSNAANDYMPTWSPRDTAIAFVSSRAGTGVWAASLTNSGSETRLTPTGVTASAPAWGPGGLLVYHSTAGGASRLELAGSALTGSENVFPFRAAWTNSAQLYYTADGKIRRRDSTDPARSAATIEFTARLSITRPSYTRHSRNFDSRDPQPVRGIVAPALSPDANSIVFAALGDIWMVPASGGRPTNLTRDAFLDTEPAWSPDGSRIVYSSDKGGGFLNLWVREIASGSERQLTSLNTSAMGAAWSPDGSRIAFLDVDGLWRRAAVSVVNVATGEVTRLRGSMFGPGTPVWSPDGQHVLVASLVPFSSRFREGTNQVLVLPASGTGAERVIEPSRSGSLDSRSGAGPALSRDGRQLAFVSWGLISIAAMNPDLTPSGPVRTIEHVHAHAPSWAADSRTLLMQSDDQLVLMDAGTARLRPVPLDFTYSPAIPTGRLVIHGGQIVNGLSSTASGAMDIVVDGNRIRRIEPHGDALHAGVPASQIVDATGLFVMPGLIEYHTHLQKDMGAAHMRSYLAFGITAVRSPGSTPYEAVEDREAIDAGVRVGPRIFTAGYLMEWQRAYYKMSVAIANDYHLDLELGRSRALGHDLLKSYVRMPDLQQKRIIEFAHQNGIPASSHEIFPSALSGIDGVEHTTGTSRRGFSPKVASLQRTYSDVYAIIGAAQMTFTPTLTLSGTYLNRMLASDSTLRTDARFNLMVPWVRDDIVGARGGGGARAAGGARGNATAAPQGIGPLGEMILSAKKAGARIVAGTDTPNPANLHAELMAYVAAGMTNVEALQAATVTPANALALDAGSVAVGKLADLAIVSGNPLADIANARRVRYVVANGRVFSLEQLLNR